VETSPSTEPIGERLRRLREERGLTQRALASGGVSHAHISRIESGSRVASVKALRVLAQRLGVSPDYLETGVEASGRDELEQRLGDADLALRLGTDPTVRAGLLRLRDDALHAGELAVHARASALAGLAAARDGDQRAAIELLETATAHTSVDPSADPDLFVTLGSCYLALGREPDAIALYERCLADAAGRVRETRAAQVRFATHLSYALADGGRLEQAATLLEGLTADPDPDPYSRVRLEWALGRLHAMQGDPEEALAHMGRAIHLLESTEDDLQRARAELVCAEICAWQGWDERAVEHLSRCTPLREGVDADDVGAVRALDALLAIRRGDREAAEAHVLAALQLLGESAFGRPLACLALLLVHASAGALDDARHAYDEGMATLEAAQMTPDAVQLSRAWATELERAGETAEATAVRGRAQELERRLRAPATR
jgi:transcriptional regulator with XRE-family HTH domain